MVMSAAVQNSVENDVIRAAFERMLPELQSRAERLARRHRKDRQTAVSEALSAMYFNFSSAAHRGRWLGPKALGWAAKWFLKFRCMSAQQRQQPTISIHDQPETIAELISENQHDPVEHARVKLDWDAISGRLSVRLQLVLRGLISGYSKMEIAKQLNVSPCRVTQHLQKLAVELLPYTTL